MNRKWKPFTGQFDKHTEIFCYSDFCWSWEQKSDEYNMSVFAWRHSGHVGQYPRNKGTETILVQVNRNWENETVWG